MLKKIKAKIYTIALAWGEIKFRNTESKVLYYHDVHADGEIPATDMSTPMSLFKQHIDIIKANGFEIVDEITKANHQVMLTFDDGYVGIYKNRAFFEENGLKPTVFIITAEIGQNKMMSKDEILTLSKQGFLFQSHTHSHPDLNLCDEKQLEEEYLKSNKILTDILGIEVESICFPKGFFTKQAVASAYKNGYKRLYASIPGNYLEKNSFKVICRNLVQFSPPKDFKAILFGGLNIFKKRYAKQHYYE
jgi:peptidoglycan/xylan/chitin deacetylase (PgdA/CDA1 family)